MHAKPFYCPHGLQLPVHYSSFLAMNQSQLSKVMEIVRLTYLLLVYCAVLTQSQSVSLRLTWNSTTISQDPGIPDPRVLIYHDEINIRTDTYQTTPDGDGVLICRLSTTSGDLEWLRPGSSSTTSTDDFRTNRQVVNGAATRLQLARAVQTPSTAGNEGLWFCNGGGLSRRYVSLYRRGNGGIGYVAASLLQFESNIFTLVAETIGGPPTNYSWRRTNGGNLKTGIISIEADPHDISDDRVNCLYRSTLQIVGFHPGVYEYQASNRATPRAVTVSLTIEGGSPSNLQLVQTGINVVTLTWNPPPGPPEQGYQVQYTGNNIRSTRNTSLTIDMLSLGEYSFQVTSLSQHFPGGTVGPETITVKGAVAPDLTASQLTATSVTVSWIQPMFSYPVRSYQAHLRRLTSCDSLGAYGEPKNLETNDMTEVFEGLEEYINYRAEIIASFQSPSSFTVSPVTAEIEFTTLATAPSEVPSNVVAITTSRTISVSWNAIDCANQNGPNFHYDVDFQQMDGGAVPIGIVDNEMFTVEGLQPFTNYTFRVRGVNDAGKGSYTSPITLQTKEPHNGGNVTVAVSVSVVVSVLLAIILNNVVLVVGYYIACAYRRKASQKREQNKATIDDTGGMTMRENAAYGPVTSSQQTQNYIYDQPDDKAESEYDVVK